MGESSIKYTRRTNIKIKMARKHKKKRKLKREQKKITFYNQLRKKLRKVEKNQWIEISKTLNNLERILK